jgi:microcystin-dependent protein
MADPYLGEIRMFGGNFAPANWAFCNGQLLPIIGFEELFGLIGTTYGGNGQTEFALPNLQARLPVHMGGGFSLGQMAGEETVTLTVNQLPIHNHEFLATTDTGSVTNPGGATLARFAGHSAYFEGPATTALAPQSLLPATGGNEPHTNMQPFLCISFIIALYGIYPSPN